MTAGSGLVVLLLWSLGVVSFAAGDTFLPGTPSVAFKGRLSLHDRSSQSRLQLLEVLRGGQDVVAEAPSTSNDAAVQNLDDTSNDTLPVYNFSLIQPGDGSQTDPDGIPGRFLRMQKNNRHKAEVALNATLKWRTENHVDTILSKPHPKFDVCKRVVPHYFAGRDPTDHVIFVQQPGKLDMPLAILNNLTTQELLMHYVWTLEYCWNVIEPRPDQTMTSVIDLSGTNLRSVRSMFHFVMEFIHMMSQHYPQRSYKTLLVNCPRWFGTIYRLIAPILRESTRSKIQILSGGKRQREALQLYLGDLAPKELMHDDSSSAVNGTDDTGPNSPMEQDLRAFCVARLDEAGEVMQPVLEVDTKTRP